MECLPASRVSAVAADLLQIATARESSDPHSHPPELGHELRQTPARPGSATTLRNLEDIEQQLRGNTLDTIIAYLAARTVQREPPRIGVSRDDLRLRLSQFFHE
jgi:hypothetical protein